MHQPMPDVRKQGDASKTLNAALAATFNFYFCAHSYHWNVTGPTFSQLHALFGEIYADAHTAVDDLAEHLRTLDEEAPRSLNNFVNDDSYDDANADSAADMVKDLEEENEALIGILNDATAAAIKAGKAGLANFLQDRIDRHNKWGWMLRATAA